MQPFWNIYSWCYDRLRGILAYQAMYESVLSLAAPTATDDVLDMGAGTGNARRYSPAGTGHWHLVDASTAMLGRAQRQLTHAPDTTYQRLDFTTERSALEGVFDVILSINALYTDPDPTGHLAWLAEHAKPGARLVVCGPWSSASMSAVLAEHKRLARQRGCRPQLVKLVLTNLPLVFMNLVIKRRFNGQYRNPQSEADLRGWFSGTGWRITTVQPTYGSANYLVLALKEKS